MIQQLFLKGWQGIKMKKKVLFVLILFLILGGLIIGMSVYYRHNQKICNQIEHGEPISEKAQNGYTAPAFMDRFFTATGLGEVKILLVEACRAGHEQAVTTLLANGADPNLSMKGYPTPIEAVIFGGHDWDTQKSILLQLIEHGADVNAAGSEVPLIIQVAERFQLSESSSAKENIVVLLLDNGGVRESETGNTILHFAVRATNPVFVEMLINKYEFNVNQTGYEGQTPLISAICFRYPNAKEEDFKEIVRVLLDKGADPAVQDNKGKTAYDYAIDLGYYDIANMLT